MSAKIVMPNGKQRLPAGFLRVEDVKRRSRFQKLIIDGEINCPGGEHVAESFGGTASRCRITHSTVTAAKDPSSLAAFCMGAYTSCPVWQAEKEELWSKQDRSQIAREGEKRDI